MAKIIRACQELPGQDLLDLDEAGNSQNVSSSGNSPTICRKCYLHPEGLSSYMDGNLMLEIKSEVDSELRESLVGLKPEEVAVLALLRNRLAKKAADASEGPPNG